MSPASPDPASSKVASLWSFEAKPSGRQAGKRHTQGVEMRRGLARQTPFVGMVVHYVSRGSADGVFAPKCRAAIVAEIPDGALPPADSYPDTEFSSDVEIADLTVLNPQGLFFDRCVRDEHSFAGGTWHMIDYSGLCVPLSFRLDHEG